MADKKQVMLRRIEEIEEITTEERVWNVLTVNFLAVDMESGAFLILSRGRSITGRSPLYRLFLPVTFDRETVFSYRNVSAKYRSLFRANSLSEAIEIANQKLPKLIEKLSKEREKADGAQMGKV